MSVDSNLRNAIRAIEALKRTHDASAALKPLGTPMSEEELRERAELVEKVIQTRSKLKALRDRSEGARITRALPQAARGVGVTRGVRAGLNGGVSRHRRFIAGALSVLPPENDISRGCP
ncbi:hypothetical protein [Dokdonella fugitiva]|jgi:hypothetical protein|uniref:hypothetical protein n=1 Tax=Dokdonella fugitiva TaxID=328517 RepID=UPI0015F9BB57|nr:hypothetical protein [Dokdonella fugitiva]MBA8882302.1 hypothetical protein [Dokdonella fugitiva]